MADSPGAVSGKDDALAALGRVVPERQKLQNADKRHKRETEADMNRLTKFYEDRLSERRHRTFLAVLVVAALGAAYAVAIMTGKPELADKILTAILPTGAFAIGGLVGKGKKESGTTPPPEAAADA